MSDFRTVIDYDSHPAFTPFANVSPREDTSVILLIWAEIDAAMELIKKSEKPISPGFVQRYFDSQISVLLNEIGRISGTVMPSSAWFRDVIPEVLKKTGESLLKEIQYELEKNFNVYPVVHSPNSINVYKDLAEQGVSFQLFPQEYLDMIYDQIAPQRAEIEGMVHKDPSKLHSLPLGLGGPYFQITSELLKAYGILDGATLHSRNQLEIIYVALCLSCSSQNWFRDCYADVGVPTSKLAYLHYDHDFDVTKILMYLKPVTFKNGPFRIIPGSSKWIPSRSQSLFFKQLDSCADKKLKKQQDGQDSYYRPIFKSSELRKEFMKMPKELRGSSHFGDDLMDNTPLSDRLLSQEVPLVSDTSNCAVFLGAETLHRGGLTEEGQRWAFQIALRKVGVGCG